MNRTTQIQPGQTLTIVCEDNSLSQECDRLRAQLAVTGYTVRWDGSCWLARHTDNPTLSVGAMTPEAAVADLRMAIEATPDDGDG